MHFARCVKISCITLFFIWSLVRGSISPSDSTVLIALLFFVPVVLSDKHGIAVCTCIISYWIIVDGYVMGAGWSLYCVSEWNVCCLSYRDGAREEYLSLGCYPAQSAGSLRMVRRKVMFLYWRSKSKLNKWAANLLFRNAGELLQNFTKHHTLLNITLEVGALNLNLNIYIRG
jgi:hypothetical protein